MPTDSVLRSIDLMSREVMPYFQSGQSSGDQRAPLAAALANEPSLAPESLPVRAESELSLRLTHVARRLLPAPARHAR